MKEILNKKIGNNPNLKKIIPNIQTLLEKAKNIQKNAVAKLSTFKVGAAILTNKNNIFCGCNIEFDNYSNTIHAEEAAISALISNSPDEKPVCIAIFTESSELDFPCGMCRQSLYEFGGKEMLVISSNKDKYEIKTMNELLPYAFQLSHHKRFYIDIDGVACAHADAICEWLNNEYNLSVKYDDVVNWNPNFGPIDFLEAIEICYSNPKFIMNMKPHDGFIDFLRIIEKQMEITFVTNRTKSKDETKKWINKNFGNYKVLFEKDKEKLNFNYLIDDLDKTIIKLHKYPKKTGFLIQRPWNNHTNIIKKIKLHNNLHFIKNFNQVFDLI